MTAGRKPSTVAFRVIEGGGDPVARPTLHRVPMVPREDSAPPLGAWLLAGVACWTIIGLAAWAVVIARGTGLVRP